jgi:hypothetical protein
MISWIKGGQLLYLNYETYFGGVRDEGLDEHFDGELVRDEAALGHNGLDLGAFSGALKQV